MKPDFDDPDTYELLLKVCSDYQVDPSMSIESENFFRNLLSQFHDTENDTVLEDQLRNQIAGAFIAVEDRPRWIQGAEWPFMSGQPMIFVGQTDISIQANPGASKYFHDDTSFYLFISLKKGTEVIIQQF